MLFAFVYLMVPHFLHRTFTCIQSSNSSNSNSESSNFDKKYFRDLSLVAFFTPHCGQPRFEEATDRAVVSHSCPQLLQ